MGSPIFIRKLFRNIEDYGLKVALRKAAHYALRPAYVHTVYRIYGIDLENWKVKQVDRNDLEFRTIHTDERGIIGQIEDMEEWLHNQVQWKLDRGGLCLVASEDERLVGFNLIAFGEVYIPLIGYRKVFRKDEAWSEQITVHKDYRRKGLASALRYKIFAELKNRGVKRVYGGTLRSNEPNLRLSSKVGFKELTDIHYTNFLGHKSWRHKKIRR